MTVFMSIFGCQLSYANGVIQYDILVTVESNYYLYHGLRFGRREPMGRYQQRGQTSAC